MKVLLFAEGSGSIGAGHQVRSAALAEALLRRGHEAILATRGLDGSAHPWAWEGLRYEVLSGAATPRAGALEAVRRQRPDVTVVDHYELEEDALAEIANTSALALIDDVPSPRAAPVGLVINSAPEVTPADYPKTPVALGPEHALVRSEFAATPTVQRAPRVLAALGSSPSIDRAAILEALLDATPLAIDWVGPLPRASTAGSRLRCLPHQDASAMAELMARSQMGLLSASSICFEAACAGLPFVALEGARNQEWLARGLASLGVPVLRIADAGDRVRLREALERAARGRLKVDGRGPDRVAARVLEMTLRTQPVGLRPVVWSDAAALLAWANDEGTRRGSFDEHVILEREHETWLVKKLLDPEARLFVAIDEATAGGTARLDREAGVAAVSLAVAPDRRRRGMAGRILEALREWSRAAAFAERLEALVREDNLVSLRLFERAGYARTGRLSVKGLAAIRFERQV